MDVGNADMARQRLGDGLFRERISAVPPYK